MPGPRDESNDSKAAALIDLQNGTAHLTCSLLCKDGNIGKQLLLKAYNRCRLLDSIHSDIL